LKDRLLALVRREGGDINRLRRQTAFDRLLCRLFREANAPWLFKGDYAMELRIQPERPYRRRSSRRCMSISDPMGKDESNSTLSNQITLREKVGAGTLHLAFFHCCAGVSVSFPTEACPIRTGCKPSAMRRTELEVPTRSSLVSSGLPLS